MFLSVKTSDYFLTMKFCHVFGRMFNLNIVTRTDEKL